MVIGTLLKAGMILVGIGLSLYYLIKGSIKGDSSYTKKAIYTFLLSIAAVIVFTIIEYLILFNI